MAVPGNARELAGHLATRIGDRRVLDAIASTPRDPFVPETAPAGGGSSLVRPYAVTGGRTQPKYQLQIEAMVAASHYEARDLSILSPECQANPLAKGCS